MPRKKSAKPRSEVVGVRLSQEELGVLDDLVEIGLFSSRSDIVYWLIKEGLRTIPVEKLSSRAREIRRQKESALKVTQQEWQKLREDYALAWGEAGREPVSGETSIGAGLIGGDPPLGIDYDRRLIVTDRGTTKIPLNKKDYSEREKAMLQRVVGWLEKSRSRIDDSRLWEDDLFKGLLAESKEALKR